jgi:hypothetical protein
LRRAYHNGTTPTQADRVMAAKVGIQRISGMPDAGAAWVRGARVPIVFESEVTGIAEMRDFWRSLPPALRRRAGWGAWYAAQHVWKASQDMVPFRTGDTMRSAGEGPKKDVTHFDTSAVGSYSVSYDTEYAWKIHESTWQSFRQPGDETTPYNPEPIPPTTRGRQAKYLEKALAEVADDYQDIVGQEIRGMIGAIQAKRVMSGGPRLVKKGTSSGGATVPVALSEPEPPGGGGIGDVFASESSRRGGRSRGASGNPDDL